MVLKILRVVGERVGEDDVARLDPDMVVGPEWVRGLAVGRIFVPFGKRAEKFVELVKRAWIREHQDLAKFDETTL